MEDAVTPDMETLELDNRRRAPRVKRHVPIQFRTRGGRVGRGVTVNVSKTGARLLLYDRPDEPELLLKFPEGLQLHARTVWEEPWNGRKCVVAGVNFADLDLGPVQRAGLDYLSKP